MLPVTASHQKAATTHEHPPQRTWSPAGWLSCRRMSIDARAAAAELIALYGQAAVADADVVVALGGDGFMLQTLQRD